MSLRQTVLAFASRIGEASMLRRLTQAWLATGAVPVVHIVADLDDADLPALLVLQPVPVRRGATVSRRVHQ